MVLIDLYNVRLLVRFGAQIWQVLSRCYLTPRQWVFAQFTQVDPKSEMEIVFLFLRYWGFCHNWNMRNSFVFDGRQGVKAYIRKLKGVLMWQFSLLEQVETLSLVECSSYLLTIQHVPLPMQCSVVSGWPYSIVTPIISSVFYTHLLI